MRFFMACRVFFQILFNSVVAERVREALAAPEPKVQKEQPAAPKLKQPPAPNRPARSEALTLLATLQREARLVDLVQEPLADYSDAQIGAAARDVLRDCGKVLQRMFALEPLATEPEGAALTVPAGFDAARYRLTGNVAGEPPYRGKLAHHGWQATICEVPAWNGSDTASRIVAPVEVELA